MERDRDLEKINREVPEDAVEEDEEEGWDGSEAELVADEDAAVYEDVQTGIRVNYVLRWREIYRCLKGMGYIKTTGTRAVIETVILAIAAVFCLINWFNAGAAEGLTLAIVCILLIAVVWVVPELGLRSQAKKRADGREFSLEIYPDAITVEQSGDEWEIPLDGETECAQYGNHLVLSREGKMVILPLRCVEPGVLPEVQAMIMAGTTPRED